MSTVRHRLPPARPPRLPGVVLSATLAVLAIWLSGTPWMQRHSIAALTPAIVLGILVGNLAPRATAHTLTAGIDFSRSTLLRAGIVLYGLRLTLQDVRLIGVDGLLIDTLVVVSTFLLASWLGTRLFGMERTQAMLIGAGSAICGAAAVMATAPVVKGRAEQVAVAVATVVVFGTLAMFLYPLLAHWGIATGGIRLDESGYGIFIGSTVHEVAQVVAAGRAVGEQTANAAVITKMVRVMLLAPFLLALSAWLARGQRAGSPRQTTIAVPWFAFGFIGMVAFNSLQLLPEGVLQVLVTLDTALLAMAMAALGLTTRASALRQAGPRPMLLAALLAAWLLAGGLLINLAVHAVA